MFRLRRAAAVLAVASLAALGPATAVSADPGPKSNGVQHFIGVSSDPTSEGFTTVIATGPITAVGSDVFVDDITDLFTFPDGTITVVHESKDESETYDPATCTATFADRGTYVITGGTGAYAGASGKGKYSLAGTFVGCDENEPPTEFNIRLDAKGPIHL